MASPLADFQGDAIYVDTNVLVGLVDANSVYHLACAPFFQRAVDPQMRQEMQTSGILPRDAIHLAVMQRLGLTAIASDDEGFEHHQGIDLFMP
jgi:predicted nucleic acid-binding protein